MKKEWIVVVVVLAIGFLFIGSLLFIKNHYDTEAKALKEYEKENCKLRLIAERRELQFKIASLESRMNMRVATEVTTPVDPNE